MTELRIPSRPRTLGGGLTVGRVLPFARRRMVGPFIFFDHMGPVDIAPGGGRALDVLPHPHIGLSTVTYLFEGEIMHRDSVGSVQALRPREVNWMTAGRGITHSERLERAQAQGDTLHGIQAWVALADGCEEMAPSFTHHAGAELPQWHERGVHGCLIAGALHGLVAAPATTSPLFYAHVQLEAGALTELPSAYSERAVYVATGAVALGGQRLEAGTMLVLGAQTTSLRAEVPSTVMFLGGEPVGERLMHWNFVSSSRERLAQAAADWQAGRMKLPDADAIEFVPMPADAHPPPPAMS